MKQLKEKAVAHTGALVSTKVTYGQAWLHHILCFIPSVSYPLAFCHLSDSQLHSLQSNYLVVLKNKLGFIWNYSHDVSFRPRSYGGLGFWDLQMESGLSTLEMIIHSLQTPGYTQSIVITFLCYWKHVSGMPQSLL